jgi:hypothetical protein
VGVDVEGELFGVATADAVDDLSRRLAGERRKDGNGTCSDGRRGVGCGGGLVAVWDQPEGEQSGEHDRAARDHEAVAAP